MPRVIAFRLGLLWVAFRVNDYGEAGPRRFRFRREAAIHSAAWADETDGGKATQP